MHLHRPNHQKPEAIPMSGNCVFGRFFLLRLCRSGRIKRSQAISMGNFAPQQSIIIIRIYLCLLLGTGQFQRESFYTWLLFCLVLWICDWVLCFLLCCDLPWSKSQCGGNGWIMKILSSPQLISARAIDCTELWGRLDRNVWDYPMSYSDKWRHYADSQPT